MSAHDPATKDQPPTSVLLWVVMPVYNEAGCLEEVVEEWLEILRAEVSRFVLCILNDGSTDNSLDVLLHLKKRHGELKVINKPNSGHGQTCFQGYRLARQSGAGHILQIDSDGQCDPRFLPSIWALRNDHTAIYGNRARREDGITRSIISRLLSIVVFAASGVYVRDANVPYRLMQREALAEAMDRIPPGVDLVNACLAVIQQKAGHIHWVDIVFRPRIQGVSKTNLKQMATSCGVLIRQLFRYRSVL